MPRRPKTGGARGSARRHAPASPRARDPHGPRQLAADELRQFRLAIDSSPDLIYLVDADTLQYIYVNDTACRLSGYTRAEHMRIGPLAVSTQTPQELKRIYAEVIASGDGGVTTEHFGIGKDSRRGWFEVHRRAIRVGEKWIIVSVSRDVTQRKLDERAAERQRRMYAALSAVNEAILHAASPADLYQRVCDAAVHGGKFVIAAILISDPDGRRVDSAAVSAANAARLPPLCLSVDDAVPEGRGLVGTAFRTRRPCISHNDRDDERVPPWRREGMALGVASAAAIPIVRDGRTIGVLLFNSDKKKAFEAEVVALLERIAENVAFALENIEHAAERRRAAEALRASEEKHRAILDNMFEGYWEVDLAGNFTFFNDTQCRLLGFNRAEMTGLNYRAYYDKDDVRRIREIFNRIYRTGEPERMAEWTYKHRDGTRVILESAVQLMRDAQGKPVGFRGETRDVTAAHQAQEQLRQSEERFRALTDLSSDWFWEQDSEFRFTKSEGRGVADGRYNPTALVIGKRPWELPGSVHDPVAWERHHDMLRRHESFRDFEHVYRDKNGRPYYISVNGAPVFGPDGEFLGYRGTSRDITRRKNEERLLALEHAVARTLAEADSTHKILQTVIRLVCESQQWETGGYWSVDAQARTLRLTTGWNGTGGSTTKAYYKDALGVTLSADGPLGEPWRTGMPRWRPSVDADATEQWRHHFPRTGDHASFSFPVAADGKVIGILTFAARRVMKPDERLLQAVGVIGNQVGQFLQRKQALRVLRESEARFRALTELSSDWYWEQDVDGRFVRVESRAGSGDAWRPRLLGKHPWETGYSLENQGGWGAYRALCEAQEPYRDLVMRRTFPDGTRRYISVTGEPVFDTKGRFHGYRGVAREITQQKTAEERIQYLATHDGLTDLPNRNMFAQMLNAAIHSARRYRRCLAVLFIDLDRFKVINDTLGHESGDRLLREVAARLKRALRTSDVIARLGGDEFVVLAQELEDPNQAATVARKILATVVEPVSIAGQECRVTTSIGICTYAGGEGDEQSLMKKADMAMYLAKDEGKNTYRFYSAHMQEQSLKRLTLETNLRQALDRGELSLEYQAKIDLQTGNITGVEALARWHRPQVGPVPPEVFIPVAEESGLIVPIGRWVMQAACAQAVAWQRQGLPAIGVAVNLSLRQFLDPALLEGIHQALRDSGLAPELLELEITEGTVMHDAERATRVLDAIKDLGVRLAIDDFGTGYSSLAQIKRFPIDTLKVDRSFVRDVPQNREDRSIVEAIIAMGKSLGLMVVAEGVETAEQAAFLREHACDEMQGYFFSKPLPPDGFAELLRTHPGAGAGRAPHSLMIVQR